MRNSYASKTQSNLILELSIHRDKKIMKKKECPSCAMEIDSHAIVCPICAYEFKSSSSLAVKWVAILLLVVTILFMVVRWL